MELNSKAKRLITSYSDDVLIKIADLEVFDEKGQDVSAKAREELFSLLSIPAVEFSDHMHKLHMEFAAYYEGDLDPEVYVYYKYVSKGKTASGYYSSPYLNGEKKHIDRPMRLFWNDTYAEIIRMIRQELS